MNVNGGGARGFSAWLFTTRGPAILVSTPFRTRFQTLGYLVRRFGPRLPIWIALYSFIFFVSVMQGVNKWDESWFLQVVSRVTSGEALYKDVFFGATPLPVYITAALTAIFGIEILTVKAVVAISLLATVLVSSRISKQLVTKQGFPLVLTMALLLYDWPWPGAPYAPVAGVFSLLCFSATLSWRQRILEEGADGIGVSLNVSTLALAGITAGLSFSAKQNIGLFALAALLVNLTIVCRSAKWRWARLARIALLVLATFSLTSLLVLLPTWVDGGIPKLVEYGFANKTTYLRHAGESYFDWLGRLPLFLHVPKSFEQLATLNWLSQYLLPPVTLIALLAAWLRDRSIKHSPTTLVLIFVGFGFLGLFPRSDGVHLNYVMPEILVGLSYAWHRLISARTAASLSLVNVGLVLWLGLGLAALAFKPVSAALAGNYQFSTLPGFRGVLAPPGSDDETRSQVETLKEEAGGERLFILSPAAGYYYLVSGLKNPFPFDYPLVTTFGPRGQLDVIEAFSQQQVPTVCLDSQMPDTLRPALLEDYVQNRMVRGSNAGFCTVYRAGR